MTESSNLRTTLEDGALLVELNRPDKRNALDETLQRELLRVFTDAARDIPSHGGCARLVKLVGLARARDIVLGGQDLDASEAFRHGLVTQVVPHEKLLDEAKERLRFILERAPQAYGLSKRLLHLSASVDLESGLFAESLLVGTEDHKEGVQAARARRALSFKGR